MKDVFLVRNGMLNDIFYALYTEGGLGRIQRTFEHPASKNIEYLIRREKGAELDRDTKAMVKKIATGCDICNTHAPTPGQ